MIDFLLITALEKESKPLRRVFKAERLPKGPEDSYQYYEARLDRKAGLSYSMRLVCAGGKGPAYTTAALAAAIPKWKPRYVIMTGIAATIPEEGRRIRNILVADTIVDLSEWKVLPSEDQVRASVYACDFELVNSIKEFLTAHRKTHVGVIVAQTHLVKSARFRSKLVDLAGKVTGKREQVIGIEMEGGGLGVGIRTLPRDLKPGFIMIKGAVDLANYHKNDTAQKQAAREAAKFVRDFLIYGPVGKSFQDKLATTSPIGMPIKVGYSLGTALLEKASELYTNCPPERARELMKYGQGAYRNPFIAPYLRWKYPGKPLLDVAGHAYPVAIYPVNETQQVDPESVLHRPLSRSRQPDNLLLPGSAKYRALAHRLDLEMYDRPCFTMKRLLFGESLQIECELGSYLRALDTCDEIAWEIYTQHDQLLGASTEDFEKFDSRLTFRARLHSEVPNPVCDGTRRSAAVAVSVLLAFYDDRELVLLAKRRGKQSVAVHLNMVHVIPSFMFQPATTDLDNEFSVKHNLFREYPEELFNRPEPEEPEGDWGYFYGDARLKYLVEMLDSGKAQIYLTGIAVNLLNFRPEICLLLYIQDPGWYAFHRRHNDPRMRFQFNDEWMRIIDMGDNAENAIARIKYCRDEANLLINAGLQPWEFVPSGAAALWLGKRMLDRLV